MSYPSNSPFDKFETCASTEELRNAFSAEIAKEGYTASACGAFILTERGPEGHFFFVDWPETWLKLYVSRNFVAHDYTVDEARQRISPFTWLDAKSSRTLSLPERDLWKTANQWGWTDGFTVPIHGPCGYFGLVNLAGKHRDLPSDVRRKLHLLCIAVHDRCRVLLALNQAKKPKTTLSSRELECLRWVASGKTDLEISGIMGIAATTVKGHVNSARLKLEARTRSHAVARMILYGFG